MKFLFIAFLAVGAQTLCLAESRAAVNDPPVQVFQLQYKIPVLTNRSVNPVLRVNIRVNGAEEVVNSFRFSLAGTTNPDDVLKAQLYYAEKDGDIKKVAGGALKLLAEGDKEEQAVSFRINQALSRGDNYFWLSYRLKNNAALENYVGASLTGVGVSGKPVFSSPPLPANRLRLGIAVRQHGQDEVHTSRIPGLATTNKGTLLAIFDARYESPRDLQGDIDIGLNRSTDGGNTWEPMRIAIDIGSWGDLPQKFNGVSDACILVDKNSDAIYIAGLWMYGVLNDQGKWVEDLSDTSSNWNHQWRNKGSQPGYGVKQTAQFLIVKSTDDGKTWSKPVNITRQVKKRKWWLAAPAPGNGITLQDGTLVFPSQGRDEKGNAFSTITYSKNGGKTWKAGRAASKESTTECAVVELKDGSLMLNMRANKNRDDTSARNGRVVAITRNSGRSWTVHPSSSHALPEPTCMASLHKQGELLFFSNPASKRFRENFTIKVSADEGLTWPAKYWILCDELRSRGYSCLSSVDENTIGVLYESSQADMVFQRFRIAEFFNPLSDTLNSHFNRVP